MTSITGIKTRLSGFTLIEVMVTTAVLSLTAVLIYEALFLTADTFSYCQNYLNVIPWLDEKIWQAQNDLSRFGALNQQAQGEFVNNNKNFKWSLAYNFIDEPYKLYRIDLALWWREGKRDIKVSRTAFAQYAPKQ